MLVIREKGARSRRLQVPGRVAGPQNAEEELGRGARGQGKGKSPPSGRGQGRGMLILGCYKVGSKGENHFFSYPEQGGRGMIWAFGMMEELGN